jgi:hypothetical protein
VQWDKGKKLYRVRVKYKCLDKSLPRGGYVTFITYPDFGDDDEDSYELFAKIKVRTAKQEFYPKDLFTTAAIGDGGETALTLDRSTLDD